MNIVVVSDLADWPLELPDVVVTLERGYLTDPRFAEEPRATVINLCRSYRYQRGGYYVSLLAEARGHRPLPSIATMQDLKSPTVAKFGSVELDSTIQRSLEPIASDHFDLSVYFGRNLARRHQSLAGELFRLFQAPFMRVRFAKRRGRWRMLGTQSLAVSDIPNEHREFAFEAARDYLTGRRLPPRRRKVRARYHLAILRDPSDPEPASNDRAIKRFVRAGEATGFAVEVVGRQDFDRVSEFDALFIRDTTGVNHYTYRFARKAKAAGLVVVDDPELILKCLNKVYLAELLQRHRVPAPKTLVVDPGSAETILREIGLPCVLKQPDSAFSAGVVKAASEAELREQLDRLFEKSSLVVAQEFCPTQFDWRVGVLDGRPLYACKYYMARQHWQIIERDRESGKKWEGRWDAVPVELVPTAVVRAAVRAAGLFGDQLFGVDLKELGGKVYVIEVNENPSIDAGVEDGVLKEELYLRIMRFLMGRVEQRKLAGWA